MDLIIPLKSLDCLVVPNFGRTVVNKLPMLPIRSLRSMSFPFILKRKTLKIQIVLLLGYLVQINFLRQMAFN